MAYAEILYGRNGRVTRLILDGADVTGKKRTYAHMAMEPWNYKSGDARVYHEWPDSGPASDLIGVLGNGVQPYRVRSERNGRSTNIEIRYYACGDVKERIERDFNETVAPAIRRNARESLPKNGKLVTHGILDPRVDEFEWPRNIRKDELTSNPPCIELTQNWSRAMEIVATIPPIVQKGKVTFAADLGYDSNGVLIRASVLIVRRERWDLHLSVSPRGTAWVTSAEKLA